MIDKNISRAIRFYRYFLSPYLGNHCRFQPTCSFYTLQAIEKYGSWQGLRLGLKRIFRCHPGYPGGSDPLP